jgi:hypothetical protein
VYSFKSGGVVCYPLFACSSTSNIATTSTPCLTAQSGQLIFKFLTLFFEESGNMSLESYDNMHSRVHRSPRNLGNSHAQDLAFSDRSRYYETNDSTSQITVSTSSSRRNDSASTRSIPQSENSLENGYEPLHQFFISYSVRQALRNQRSCSRLANHS